MLFRSVVTSFWNELSCKNTHSYTRSPSKFQLTVALIRAPWAECARRGWPAPSFQGSELILGSAQPSWGLFRSGGLRRRCTSMARFSSRTITAWAALPARFSKVHLDGRSVLSLRSCWSRMATGPRLASLAGFGNCATGFRWTPDGVSRERTATLDGSSVPASRGLFRSGRAAPGGRRGRSACRHDGGRARNPRSTN